MDIYLDLTLLMNLLIYCFIFLYMNKLGNVKFSLARKIIIISLLLIKFYFIPLIPDNLTLFFYVYDLIIYLLTFNNKKIYSSIFFIFLYYIFSSFFMVIEPHILMFKKVLVISSPSAMYKLIFMPIPLFIAYYLLNILKNKCVNYFYSYNGQLKYLDQIISIRGYLDSGNTLKINGLPVIFIKDSLGLKLNKFNQIEIEYITVNGEKNKQLGYEGKIALKVKKNVIIKKVIFSVVYGDHSFHNCDCLLNAYLF